jgi:hypothetical protein
MPPRTPLGRLGQHGLPNLLGGPTTAAPRFEISQHMRPAELPPAPWVPVVGTGALRHQATRNALAHQRTGPLATASYPDHKPRPPTRPCPPSPRPFAPLPPAGLIAGRHRLRVHVAAGFLHGRRDRLWRGLCQRTDRPHPHRYAAHLRQRLRRRACGPALGPRRPRSRRLHARAVGPAGDPRRPGRTRSRTARRARQLLPLRRSHDRLARRQRAHLLPPWLGSVARSGGLAGRALRGLEDHHLIDCFHRDQGARSARMARLTATTALPPEGAVAVEAVGDRSQEGVRHVVRCGEAAPVTPAPWPPKLPHGLHASQ